MPFTHSPLSPGCRRIGLLGGSFNPAHAGHRAMSLHALKQLGLDQVWWLVSPQNPLKSLTDMAPLPERMIAARNAANHPRIVVTDIEARLGVRYTADTLKALRRRFPHARFVWLMGADNMQQIARWRRWQDIFRSVPVAVFHRPAYAVGRRRGKAAQRFDRHWVPKRRCKALADMTTPAWIVLQHPLNNLSATSIRKDRTPWPRQKRKQA